MLQGSKYVQSEIGDTFREAKQFLDSGHDVLFSGTPCQIAGLKHFLRKEYTQLLTVDIVCHGVPSPMVWRDYLKSFRRPITDVKFRVKEDKVNRYLVIKSEDEILCNEIGATNSYIQGFLKDIYLRPSCYHCAFKKGKSGSDITLADYWGIERFYPTFNDGKGVSLVMPYTEQGKKRFELCSCLKQETTYEEALCGNPVIERSVKEPKQRIWFWELYKEQRVNAIEKIVKKMYVSFINRGIKYLGRRLIRNKL